MRGPCAIVGQRGFQTVSAVYKHHTEAALPMGPDNLTAGNNWNDRVLETRRRNVAAKFAKAVEPACGVDKRLVVMAFPGLMLL